jgi:cardiolipin synthase A/B
VRWKPEKIAEWFAVAVVAIILLLLLTIGFLYVTHGTPVARVRAIGDRAGPPAAGEPLFRETMELMTGTPMSNGNQVTVLDNGRETYPALFADLRSARSTITIQLYYCANGVLADTLKTILIDRATHGVRVLFLVDAIGSNFSDDYEDALEKAGVDVRVFRPVRFHSLHKISQRAHLRVIVVDGKIGYTGGFGIDDQWLGDGVSRGWRDTNVRFTGPAVLQLQAIFASSWAETSGTLLTGDVFFPLRNQFPGGGHVAGLMHATPSIGSTKAERFYALSIASARKTLFLTNAYVVPDDDFRLLLIRAARRGVDVRILLPGDSNDVKTVMYAARHRYEELLAGGVHIYEYQPKMIHAKTFVVDGVWSQVGSLNFDNRSIAFNEESSLMILDRGIGARLDSLFLRDLQHSTRIELAKFKQRGFKERLFENIDNLFSRLL